MKTSILLPTLLIGFSLAISTASAEDLKFPEEGAPMFTLTIPDAWEPEFDDDGVLEAEDKDGHSYFAIWEEDTETELSKVAEDLDEILDSYATDVKAAGEPEQITIAGMSGLLFKGTAKDKEDGSALGFEAIVVVTKEKKAAVIYYDYAHDAPESVAKRLVKILESIKEAK